MRNLNDNIKDPLFRVRDIPIYGDLILAPMAGYSDSPNRQMAREFGSAMSYTEFINAIDIVQDMSRVSKRLSFSPKERPIAFQIFDNDPARLIQAALAIFPLEPDILDINLGCSARSVSNRGAGAGLLRRPDLIEVIIRDLVKISPIPVTAKIRLGWDDANRNYLEIARILEANGASLIAVHGRTKMQRYTGQSDWTAIAEIKRTVNIPVIANGDVRSVSDIAQIKEITGCDAVMIGRGSYGNPWLFSRRERISITLEETIDVVKRHLSLMRAFYGDEWGCILFRKHLKAYFSPYPIDKSIINILITTLDINKLVEIIDSCLDIYPEA